MKVILFEFRKNILRKTVIIPLIILICINMLVIYVQYRYNDNVFTNEVNVYNSTPEEWNYYKELHRQFDGKITEKKQDEIIELYNYLREKNDKGDYEKGNTKSAKTGYVFGDYSLVESNFYLPIKYFVSYFDKNDEIVNKAKDNVDFYQQVGNEYEIEKNQYIVNQYHNRAIREFYDTIGWEKLFRYNFSDVVLIVLMFLCTLPMFHQERRGGMEDIILGTKKGRRMYVIGKYLSIILGILVFTILFTGINYLMFQAIYGMKGEEMPIYAIKDFQYSPYNLSMLQAYWAMLGLKCLALIVISTFLCIVANLSRNTTMCFVIFITSIVTLLYGSGFICSTNPQKAFCAAISPFALFKSADIFKSLYEMKVFGNFFSRISVCIFLQIIVETILILFSYWKYKSFFNKKNRKIR